MAAETRTQGLRRRKPLSDLTNTLASASSPASKPAPSLSKSSLTPAKKPRKDAAGNTRNPTGSGRRPCTPIRNGRSSLGSEKRQTADRQKDEDKTVPALPAPINVKDPSPSSQRPESLDNPGTINCSVRVPHEVDDERQVNRRKEKGKAVLVPFESFFVNDPSTSRQYEFVYNPGTLSCATFEPLTLDDQRQTLEETENKTVPVCVDAINTEGLSTSQEEFESLHTPAFEPLGVETQRQKKGKIAYVPIEHPSTPQRHPTSSGDSGTIGRAVIKPSTIYTRKQCAKRSKNMEKTITFPLSCPPPQRSRRINKIGEKSNGAVRGSSLSKSCTVPCAKPKKKKLLLPKDFFGQPVSKEDDEVKRQRAYFADIDAFELPEEEVSSSDVE